MQEFYNTRVGKKLLLHAGQDAANRACAFFDDDSITLADPTGKFGIRISKDYGTSIAGPLSIISPPEQVRFGALWKINPLVITALPSTLFTPIPWLKSSIPTGGKEVVKGITEIGKLLV